MPTVRLLKVSTAYSNELAHSCSYWCVYEMCVCLYPPPQTHTHTHTARAKAADEKFVKLREVYQKLRGEHIVLLRNNGEIQKKLLSVEKAKMDTEGEAQVGLIWR